MSVGDDDDKTVIQTQGLVSHYAWPMVSRGCVCSTCSTPHHPMPYQCPMIWIFLTDGMGYLSSQTRIHAIYRKPQKDRRTVSGCSDDVFVSSSCSFWVVLCYFIYLNMSIYIYICFISHTLGGPVADHRGTSSVCSSLAERASVASQLKTSRFSNGIWL